MTHDHSLREHGSHDDWEFTQEFWDDRYSSADRIWSGNPNAQLVAQLSDLAPGRALDAGCGEGADAIWLAGRGWSVTAVDVSVVALNRGAQAAAAALGEAVAARITWQQADLLSWQPPEAEFDLVSALYLHVPDFAGLHRRLARAVRPAGTFLTVTHHADDLHANVGRRGDASRFPTTEQMQAALDHGDWEIVVAEARGREVTDLDGNLVTVRDTVLRAIRR